MSRIFIVLERLEPCAVKVASTVLRGRSHGNITLLPDYKLSDNLLQQGRALYSEALRIYKDAEQTGNFAVPYHHGQLIELAA